MDIIISINKPSGITSHDAVSKVKRILKAKKAGHTGTLDPLATGLLLICLNRATRLASYFSSLDKEYLCTMKLGEETDTLDSEGTVMNTSDISNLSEDLVHNTIKSFKGKILQKPPMYSAIKHGGRPLYKLAREGVEVERKHREVTIYSVELIDCSLPFVKFRTGCSKGTYIRTLCDDIGKKLGVGAHMTGLQRTGIGNFRIEDSITIEELQSVDPAHPGDRGIHTMDGALSWMPELILEDSLLFGVRNGSPVPIDACTDLSEKERTSDSIRIKSFRGELIAIGRYSEVKKAIKMKMVFS
jgi:tRNA pseudouridine55 synthase